MKTATQLLIAAALAASALASLPARADEGPFEVRLRALYIKPANNSDAVPALGLPADQIEVSSKWAPDLDFEYFFTRSISSELVLTYPQRHTVSVKGVGDLGTFKHLPPTLTVKYTLLPDGAFRPYIGIGVNLTLIMDVDIAVPAAVSPTGSTLPLKLESSSFGAAGQAGFDFKFTDNWFGNVDVKYVQIRSDVKLTDGTKVSAVKVDPWLLGVGIGYRF